jgi:alkylation response protein AidB-like acyl-CoA dehydrogenase
MDFRLGEDTQALKDMVRTFAEKEIRPRAAKMDREHTFDLALFRTMAELGLTGIPVPEVWGGAGLGYLDYVVFIEEVARECGSTAVVLAVHTGLGAMSLWQFGSDRLKEKYLRRLATGEIIGAYALTEADAGSDAGALRCRAERLGDEFVVNGTKTFITNGGIATTYNVFVKTDPSQGPGKGITCLVVERDTPGFTIGKPAEKMGLNGSPTCELVFDNCRVPAENVVGEVNQGFLVAMGLLDGGRITIGAQALGIASGAFDYTCNYVKERKQFGKPIGANQGIGWMIADMATALDAARLMVHRAAWLKDQGLPHAKQAAMAKKLATDTGMEVCTDCVQLLGGYGYMSEYPVERAMRDVKVTQIYEGTNQIQRMIIARHVLGRL